MFGNVTPQVLYNFESNRRDESKIEINLDNSEYILKKKF
jgi:hypothetical protein